MKIIPLTATFTSRVDISSPLNGCKLICRPSLKFEENVHVCTGERERESARCPWIEFEALETNMLSIYYLYFDNNRIILIPLSIKVGEH